MKRVTIPGATGSNGRNCLQVIKAYSNEFKVIGLSTHHRVDLLYEHVSNRSWFALLAKILR